MSSSVDLGTFIKIFGDILTASVLGYAAYWAFSIRRALRVPSYKIQALWVGAYSLIFIITGVFVGTNSLLSYVSPYLYAETQTGVANILVGIFYIVFLFLFLPWVDSNINVGRRSDPVLRDALRWKKVRLFVWSIVILSLAVGLTGTGIGLYTGNSTTGISAQLVSVGFGAMALTAIAPGIPALLLTTRRSKDPAFRRSLKWFGIFLLLLVVNLIGGGIPTPNYASMIAYDLVGVVVGAFGGYSLYKCAVSLVPPLHRISRSDT